METNNAGTYTQFNDNSNIQLAGQDNDEEKEQYTLAPTIMRMRIGVPTLPDLDNPNTTIQRGWGKAPFWRTVYHGLNFEGTCTNRSCQAYNKTVWCKWGFKNDGYFDYFENESDIVCPACHTFVQPQNIGYTSCWWKVEGSKRGLAKGSPLVKVNSAWKYANGNGVTTYVYSPEEFVQWGRLVIKTSPANKKPAGAQ